MAQVHVLTGDGARLYQCVLHVTIPASNNSVGMGWRAALVASGLGGRTQLTAGTGSNGTVSAAELAQIQAGEVYEVPFGFQDDITMSAAERNAALDAVVAALTSETLSVLQMRLRYFGHTRG